MRRLDFVVLGLPRGGTTATAAYLSAARGVHCGSEVFPTYLNHARLEVPEAFVTCEDAHWSASSRDEVQARAAELRWYGNKTPTYFYRLPTLLAELDNCPALVCLRDLRAVAGSYARRAANARDTSWQAGRVGLFALGDALLLLHALRACPPEARVMVVPQSALQADWRAVMTRALAHVAPQAAPDFDPARLVEAEQWRTGTTSYPDLSATEDKALKRLDRAGVTSFFARPKVALLEDLREEIDAVLAQAPPNPINFMRRHVAAHPNLEVQDHLCLWSRHAARASRLYGLKGRVVKPSELPLSEPIPTAQTQTGGR